VNAEVDETDLRRGQSTTIPACSIACAGSQEYPSKVPALRTDEAYRPLYFGPIDLARLRYVFPL